MHVIATGKDGRVMDGLSDLAVSMTLPSRDLGPITPQSDSIAPYHVVAYGRMTFEGTWTVKVTGRQGRFDALDATFQVPIEN